MASAYVLVGRKVVYRGTEAEARAYISRERLPPSAFQKESSQRFDVIDRSSGTYVARNVTESQARQAQYEIGDPATRVTAGSIQDPRSLSYTESVYRAKPKTDAGTAGGKTNDATPEQIEQSVSEGKPYYSGGKLITPDNVEYGGPQARRVGRTPTGTYNIPKTAKYDPRFAQQIPSQATGSEKAGDIVKSARAQTIDTATLPPGSAVEAPTRDGKVYASASSIGNRARQSIKRRQELEAAYEAERLAAMDSDNVTYSMAGSNQQSRLGVDISVPDIRRDSYNSLSISETEERLRKAAERISKRDEAIGRLALGGEKLANRLTFGRGVPYEERGFFGKYAQSIAGFFTQIPTVIVSIPQAAEKTGFLIAARLNPSTSEAAKRESIKAKQETKEIAKEIARDPAAITAIATAPLIPLAARRVSKKGQAAAAIKKVETAKEKGKFPETLVEQGSSIKNIKTDIKTTDIFFDETKTVYVEKPSKVTTSRYDTDLVSPGVAAGRGSRGKITQTLVATPEAQFSTIKIKTTIGKDKFIRTKTEGGTTTTRVYAGDKLLAEYKNPAAPELYFTEPSRIIDYKNYPASNLPDVGYKDTLVFTEQKGVSGSRAKYEPYGVATGAERTTVSTTAKRKYARRVYEPVADLDTGTFGLDVKLLEYRPTSFRYTKYPVKEKPRKIKRGFGLIETETPALAETKQRGYRKTIYRIGYRKKEPEVDLPDLGVPAPLSKEMKQLKKKVQQEMKRARQPRYGPALDYKTMNVVDVQLPDIMKSSQKFQYYSPKGYQKQAFGLRLGIPAQTSQQQLPQQKRSLNPTKESLPSLRQELSLIQNQQQKKAQNQQKTQQRQNSRTQLKSLEKQAQKQLQEQKQIQKQIQKHLQQSLILRNRRTPPSQTSRPKPPPPTELFFSFSPKRPQSPKKKKKEDRLIDMQPKGYTPSFTSIVAKLTGRKEPKALTKSDLGLRPIYGGK